MAHFHHRLLVGLLLLAAPALSARAAVLQGTITDEKTGEELIGATVALLETTIGGFTDLDGRYRLDNVPPGTYELRVTYEFYQTKIVTELTLAADQTLDLDVGLLPETGGADGGAFRIEDLRVTAERVLSTPTAILANRMAAPTIGDAISAAQISLSPDATSGDALSRVTGLMMVDDKYVFIRGMPDRYNTTMLDGVTVVGSDIDRDKKSFAYDLIPAGLLANMEVQKSGTPDMPGDLSGGTVKINTLEFPEDQIIKLTASSGSNSLTTGEEMLAAPRSGSDWRAQDDGSRALPESLARIPVNLGSPNNGVDRVLRTDAARADLRNTYVLSQLTAEPDRSASLGYGNRWFVRDIDEFGAIASITWKNAFRAEEFHDNPTQRTVYNIPGIDPIVIESKIRDFDGTRYKQSYQLGGLLNLNYRLARRHKFLLNNFWNRSALSQVTFRAGLPETGPEYGEKTTIEWKERALDLNKLTGQHSFLDSRLRCDWSVYRFKTSVDEPDRKYVAFDEQPAPAGAPRVLAMRDNYRMWNENHETTDGRSFNVSYDAFGVGFKAGLLRTQREREVNQLAYTYDNSVVSSDNREILEWSLGSMFIPENLHWAPGGTDNSFAFDLATGYFGTYHATQDVTATYLMGDREFRLAGADLRLTGGFRVEDSRIEVITPPALENAETITALIDERNVLPSANLTWHAAPTLNVRGAYSRSVNRPEFRELSPINYYNFAEDRNIKGNPDLTQAEVENWDLRLECFPKPGEVLAVSVFRKSFTNAIEDTLQANPERFVQTWTNSPSARNSGIELEARKNLGFLAGLLDGFTLTANYFYVKSEVDYLEVETDGEGNPVATEKTRLLQGQAPWAVNLSLLWEHPRLGTSLNVLYNRVGRRLDKVGDTEKTNVYLMPRELLDVALVQRLGDSWRMKATVKNLLDTQETYLWGGSDELPFETRAYGVSAGLSFAASF